ncbi:MAG: hypothetical protein ATN34_04735 [Epulopiscium sp. Nele67-Bin002]|nr:MAG: hypothetical protein ATN34_04735 [Epulopiscium sp. Nele67-Bin002]OON93490.1 MAG: hypothetical protein ATN33_05685 [Epulopiscium sp. Nele67-Bin001]
MNNDKWIKLMEIGEVLGCHQFPQRSFFYKKFQFPVCARCTGVIVATAISVPVFFAYKISILTAIIMSAVMLADWSIQYFGIKQSTNFRRLLSGLIGGFGWSTLHLYFYSYIIQMIFRG